MNFNLFPDIQFEFLGFVEVNKLFSTLKIWVEPDPYHQIMGYNHYMEYFFMV